MFELGRRRRSGAGRGSPPVPPLLLLLLTAACRLQVSEDRADLDPFIIFFVLKCSFSLPRHEPLWGKGGGQESGKLQAAIIR